MEQLAIGASSDLIYHSGLEVNEYTPRNMLSSTGFREEGIERIITAADGLVAWHLPVRLDTVFETEQFPTGVSYLDTALANMNADCFTHFEIA
jgi:hypothetical protein